MGFPSKISSSLLLYLTSYSLRLLCHSNHRQAYGKIKKNLKNVFITDGFHVVEQPLSVASLVSDATEEPALADFFHPAAVFVSEVVSEVIVISQYW